MTAVPNVWRAALFIDEASTNCTIGALGHDAVVVVSGNTGVGIQVYGTNTRVINTRVGVGVDGMTPVPNTGMAGQQTDR